MTLTAPTTPTRRDRWGRYQVVNPTTGKLTPNGQPTEIPAPCCERFLPVSP